MAQCCPGICLRCDSTWCASFSSPKAGTSSRLSLRGRDGAGNLGSSGPSSLLKRPYVAQGGCVAFSPSCGRPCRRAAVERPLAKVRVRASPMRMPPRTAKSSSAARSYCFVKAGAIASKK
jgi:hypothetical protein